jgi:hypothetical protein
MPMRKLQFAARAEHHMAERWIMPPEIPIGQRLGQMSFLRQITEIGFHWVDPVEFGDQGGHGQALGLGLEALAGVELIHANDFGRCPAAPH